MGSSETKLYGGVQNPTKIPPDSPTEGVNILRKSPVSSNNTVIKKKKMHLVKGSEIGDYFLTP